MKTVRGKKTTKELPKEVLSTEASIETQSCDCNITKDNQLQEKQQDNF